MVRIDKSAFEREFLNAKGAGPESDLVIVDHEGVTPKMIENFDRIMQARTTDDVRDLSFEEIEEIARNAKSLSVLYKQRRFLTDTTFESIVEAKGVKKRRLL